MATRPITKEVHDRWGKLHTVSNLRVPDHQPLSLLQAYGYAFEADRKIYIFADSYSEYQKYVAGCQLREDDFRYVNSPTQLRGANLVIIRTGAFWNRADRDALDRVARQTRARVYDDWVPIDVTG